ncbi:MAG: hypothetical protein ACTHO8_06375 [Solirubrobacterales bacterium]
MTHLKLLGLAVTLALALTAFAGAVTASATVLCSTNSNPCSGTKYGATTKIEGSLSAGTASVISYFAGTESCSESTFVGEVTTAGGAGVAVSGKITSLKFNSCTCAITVLNNGTFEINFTVLGNGSFVARNTELTITCSTIPCKFGAAGTGTTLGTLKGEKTTPTLEVNASLPFFEGDSSRKICTNADVGGTASWKALYVLTSPTPLFVEGS